MLKRKEWVGKRQFYRRIKHDVQNTFNEIILSCNNAKQVQSFSNTRKDNSCPDNFINSENVKDVTAFPLYESNNNIFPVSLNNDILADDSCIVNNSFNISKEYLDLHENFPWITNNYELESTHVFDLKESLIE